jgi:oxaloacetate decarboxylase alpha subunit
MNSRRYENLSNESINLVLGKYGKLPGDIEPELLAKAKSKVSGIEENNIDEEEIKKMSNELEVLCKENGLPDLSQNIEMLLTYILFPNIALSFFKELDI